MKVEWSFRSLDRLINLAEFRYPYSADRRDRWYDDVIGAAGHLASFPNLGTPAMPDTLRNVRQMLFKDVWIVYEVLDEHVRILTVRHVREAEDEGEMGSALAE